MGVGDDRPLAGFIKGLERVPLVIEVPRSIERRLQAAAQRIEADDLRSGTPEEDRLKADEHFEHVVGGMIDRGLDESEEEAGIRYVWSTDSFEIMVSPCPVEDGEDPMRMHLVPLAILGIFALYVAFAAGCLVG